MAINNPYIPGDPYSYDLKWMVEEVKKAQAVGEAAAGSAEAAAASAEAAGDSAYNAGTYVNNALLFSQNAEASAQQAAASADASADSATTAKNYADNIADSVSGIVTNWLAENITEDPTVVIDASLTVKKAAADAKATGDAINELKEAALTNVTLINNSENYGASSLNTSYVWLPELVVPAGARAQLLIPNYAEGDITIYLFSKNHDGTFKNIGSINSRSVNGIVTIPFTTEVDTYIGFYSVQGGITYGGSAAVTMVPMYRCDVSLIGSNSAFTFVNNMKWFFALKYSILKGTGSVVTVKSNGTGTYSSIIDAITNEPENTPIYVYPGVYEQDMTDCLKKSIILIGTDRNNCIIRDADGRYGHHALYISCGYFENLTIEEPFISGVSQTIGPNDLGAYAVHIDTDADYAVGKTTEFHHCTMRSDFFPGVGLGMRKDATYIFDDCTIINGQIAGRGDYLDNGTLGALYVHDSNGVQGDQYLVIKNCLLNSSLGNALCLYQVTRSPQNNRVHCKFISNVLFSDLNRYANNIWLKNNPFDADNGIYDISIGYGNSNSILNN